MTAKIKVHCFSCGGNWEILDRDNWKSDSVRTCPCCGTSIDGTTWEREVLPAFGHFMDANRELEMHSTGYNAPLFKVDFAATMRK